MVRINAIVEGRTEERFISGTLAPYLAHKSIYMTPMRVFTSRSKSRRGGLRGYAKPRADILLTLKGDKSAYCTTVFDYYGLPNTFPGMDVIDSIQGSIARTKHLEQAMNADVNHRRFVPFLVLHEFEALLFSEIQELDSAGLYRTNSQLRQLEQIIEACGSPEGINDNYETAPSRRILKLYPAFKKVLHGVDVASRIGVPKMREMCPHFNSWLDRLEGLQTL